MALDISLRDNGSNTFDIALSSGSTPTGNSNFFLFFDGFSLFLLMFFGAVLFL
jgi:hypothetical protein